MELVCFSHLRWDFVYQRPQHLLTRFAKCFGVHVWEEPLFRDCVEPALNVTVTPEGIHVVTPVFPIHMADVASIASAQRAMLEGYLDRPEFVGFVAWYYTPMALRFTDSLCPSLVIYDCMDELSGFQGAPLELVDEEQRLFGRADIVFAGGASLYASKRAQHRNVHLFPSSVDCTHFEGARHQPLDPLDQRDIPHPRIGFYGVLDERLDRELLAAVATENPEWHFVLIGPVVKIDRDALPRRDNLHYLDQKSYAELPAYLGNWDVAMLPFASNAATRFISPTKTPEYLAGGKPVVSTPIEDVVHPYGDMGLVRIGKNPETFSEAIGLSLQQKGTAWLESVDSYLAGSSWDETFQGMLNEIGRCAAEARKIPNSSGVGDQRNV